MDALVGGLLAVLRIQARAGKSGRGDGLAKAQRRWRRNSRGLRRSGFALGLPPETHIIAKHPTMVSKLPYR
jgi:hypothetical protein